MDENLWLMELESILMENDCSQIDILNICQGREIPKSIRPDVWLCCLGVRNKGNTMKQFDEVFDLPFQKQLRADCHTFVEKLGNPEEEQLPVVSDLESILTFYCKKRNYSNFSRGWIEMLIPLLSLKLERSDTYNLFEAIRDSYIPYARVKNEDFTPVYHLLQLLLQYHDPELCSFLDTKRIGPEMYSKNFFDTLFSATCSLPVILSLWDIYFQQNDPYLVFFMSLIILINARDSIMTMKDENKDTIVAYLKDMACALQQEDVTDFALLAQYYSLKTPTSFKTDTFQTFFGSQSVNTLTLPITNAFCLPVSVSELVEVSSIERPHPESCKFFLVDCRTTEEYNSGHLSNAFLLDYNLMLTDPPAFQIAVQGLLKAHKEAIELQAGGEHLCFISGESIEFVYMVISSFLQKNTKYIAILDGGYHAIHSYFGDHILDCLEDHNPLTCLVCKEKGATQGAPGKQTGSKISVMPSPTMEAKAKSSTDIFGKLSSVMKKSAEVKEKFFEYIVNPTQTSTQSMPLNQRHVLSSERYGKRYRNVPAVFSIDDDEDDTNLNNEQQKDERLETVQLTKFLKEQNVVTSFKCQEVHMNGCMYDSVLAFSETHIIVLRELDDKNLARVISKRSLNQIVKITARKRHQNLISFKYGLPDGDNLLVTDMDRFLIPNASEATKIISKLILKQL